MIVPWRESEREGLGVYIMDKQQYPTVQYRDYMQYPVINHNGKYVCIYTHTCTAEIKHNTIKLLYFSKIVLKMRYHLIPVKMAIIKKTTNNKYWQKYGRKETLVHCWCKVNQSCHCGEQYGSSSEN